MEQILPDLPTREEMREVVAPLATREEMHEAIQAAVVPLATREEMHEAIQAAVAPLATREELLRGLADLRDELRRHMDEWAERIHDVVKVAMDGIGMVDEKHSRNIEEARQRLVELIRTEAQHHVGCTRTYDELREDRRDYVKAHAKDHAENVKALEKLRGRVEKIEAKPPRKRKAS